MPRIRLVWDACDAKEWRRHVATTGWSSLEQSWAYGEAVARTRGVRVRRGLILNGDAPCALVQAFERPLGRLLRLVRIVRGPLLLHGLAAADRLASFRHIRGTFTRRHRAFLFWLPELPEDTDSAALMRASGTRRVVTGYSTCRIDLRQSLADLRGRLHGKWRNALGAAECSELRIKLARSGHAFDRLLLEYDRLQRTKGFAGHPAALLRSFATAEGAGQDVLVASARDGSDIVAAVLFLRHGQTATYSAAWAAPAGRRANAHNLLLWRGIEALREREVRWLDLGGVNTTRAPGLARFKLGLGGDVLTLAGTYL